MTKIRQALNRLFLENIYFTMKLGLVFGFVGLFVACLEDGYDKLGLSKVKELGFHHVPKLLGIFTDLNFILFVLPICLIGFPIVMVIFRLPFLIRKFIQKYQELSK
jgi:hypothetical protein